MRHSIETVQTRGALKLEKLTLKQVLKGMLLTEHVVLVAAPAVIHTKHSTLTVPLRNKHIAMCLKVWVHLNLEKCNLNWEMLMGNICQVMNPMGFSLASAVHEISANLKDPCVIDM